MTGGQRLTLILGAVLVLGVGLVLLSPDDDEQTGGESTVTTPATTTEAPATTTEAEPEPQTETTPEPARPPSAPAAKFTRIRVSAGRPVGGVKTITVKSGKPVRIEVRSDDTSDEVHIHGYDLSRNLKAGGNVRFSFTANAEGIFEIELESRSLQIAKLVVEP